jgi:hypothetical protein
LLPESTTRKYNVVWHKQGTSIGDLAAIAHCDHAITTLGTYSFWGGFLTGGHVVAMKDQWLKEKKLQQSEGNQDFYLPTWTVLPNECEDVSTEELEGESEKARAVAAHAVSSAAMRVRAEEDVRAEAEATESDNYCTRGSHFCWRNFLSRPEDKGKADATCQHMRVNIDTGGGGLISPDYDYACTCPDDYPEQREHKSHRQATKTPEMRHLCGPKQATDITKTSANAVAITKTSANTVSANAVEIATQERAAAELAAVSFGSKQGAVSTLSDESSAPLRNTNNGVATVGGCGLPAGHFLSYLCLQTSPISSFTKHSPLHVLKVINRDDGAGFFATLTDVLNHLIWAESQGLTPLVNFSNVHYGRGGEVGLDMWTEYFEPVRALATCSLLHVAYFM